MKLKFHGVRGSYAVPGPSTLRYGGNTTCLEVRAEDDSLYIIDAGTGIIGLGQELKNESLEAKLFISHYHWDHLQGLIFFSPLFNPKNKIDIYACDNKLQKKLATQKDQSDPVTTRLIKKENVVGHKENKFNRPKEAVDNLMNTEDSYHPIGLEAIASELNFHEVKKSSVVQGSINANYKFLDTHPQGYAYWKFEENGKIMVFASDYESDGFRKTGIKGTLGESDKEFVEFAKGVDVLVLDGQYTPEIYQRCKGWGHNDIEQACHLAKAVGVKTLMITHHEPLHDDDKLNEMYRQTVKYMKSLDENIKIVFAQEGMTIDVGTGKIATKEGFML